MKKNETANLGFVPDLVLDDSRVIEAFRDAFGKYGTLSVEATENSEPLQEYLVVFKARLRTRKRIIKRMMAFVRGLSVGFDVGRTAERMAIQADGRLDRLHEAGMADAEAT
jgi:hypothetical protein